MAGHRSYEGNHDHAAKSRFGLFLLTLRKRHRESYTQQAARIGGYAASTLKTYSYAQKTPTPKMRQRVADAYRVELHEVPE